MLKEIFEKAEKYGIAKGAIGIKVFGRKGYNRIYQLSNPTEKTVEKIKNAVNELIVEKNEKK